MLRQKPHKSWVDTTPTSSTHSSNTSTTRMISKKLKTRRTKTLPQNNNHNTTTSSKRSLFTSKQSSTIQLSTSNNASIPDNSNKGGSHIGLPQGPNLSLVQPILTQSKRFMASSTPPPPLHSQKQRLISSPPNHSPSLQQQQQYSFRPTPKTLHHSNHHHPSFKPQNKKTKTILKRKNLNQFSLFKSPLTISFRYRSSKANRSGKGLSPSAQDDPNNPYLDKSWNKSYIANPYTDVDPRERIFDSRDLDMSKELNVGYHSLDDLMNRDPTNHFDNKNPPPPPKGPYDHVKPNDDQRRKNENDPLLDHTQPSTRPTNPTKWSFPPDAKPPEGFRKYDAEDGTWWRAEEESSDHEPYFDPEPDRNTEPPPQSKRYDRRKRFYTYMHRNPIDHDFWGPRIPSYFSQWMWFSFNRITDKFDTFIRFVIHAIRPVWILSKIMLRIPEFTIKLILQIKVEIFRYIERRWGPKHKRDPDVYKFIPGMFEVLFNSTRVLSTYIERWGVRDPDVGAWLEKHHVLRLNSRISELAYEKLEILKMKQFRDYQTRKEKRLTMQDEINKSIQGKDWWTQSYDKFLLSKLNTPMYTILTGLQPGDPLYGKPFVQQTALFRASEERTRTEKTTRIDQLTGDVVEDTTVVRTIPSPLQFEAVSGLVMGMNKMGVVNLITMADISRILLLPISTLTVVNRIEKNENEEENEKEAENNNNNKFTSWFNRGKEKMKKKKRWENNDIHPSSYVYEVLKLGVNRANELVKRQEEAQQQMEQELEQLRYQHEQQEQDYFGKNSQNNDSSNPKTKQQKVNLPPLREDHLSSLLGHPAHRFSYQRDIFTLLSLAAQQAANREDYQSLDAVFKFQASLATPGSQNHTLASSLSTIQLELDHGKLKQLWNELGPNAALNDFGQRLENQFTGNNNDENSDPLAPVPIITKQIAKSFRKKYNPSYKQLHQTLSDTVRNLPATQQQAWARRQHQVEQQRRFEEEERLYGGGQYNTVKQ